MIRLIIIVAIFLCFIWLISELLSKKNEKSKQPRNSKLIFLILAGICLAGIIFILPKLGASFIGLFQKFGLPLLSLLRTFIPF